MALGKYCNVDGVIKQITSEYVNIGGVIKQGTINAINIGADIKQISVGEKQIWACEDGSDRLYGIDDDHTDLVGWPKYGGGIANPDAVACDDEGNTYWACANYVYKFNLAGVQQWMYAGHTSPVTAICLENRSGITYIYTGDERGTITCLQDGGSTYGFGWSRTPYAWEVVGIAFNSSNSNVYAAYAFGYVVRLQTANGNYANVFDDVSLRFTSIAIDSQATRGLYLGDDSGHIRKISVGGDEYWDQSKNGEINDLVIGHDGYGYYVNGSGGAVGKFSPLTGTNVWLDEPAGTSQGVAVDEFGNVYSTHGAYGSANAVIRKNSSSGVERWTFQDYINSRWYGIAVSPGIKAAGFS